MKIDQIKKAIKNWDISRKDVSVMKKLFSSGNCFTFELSGAEIMEEDGFIHAYLSVAKENEAEALQMLLIDSSHDRKDQPDIHERVTRFSVISGAVPQTDEVDPKDAKLRIGNWKQHFEDWLKFRSDQKKELHQVFAIPKKYLKNNRTYTAFFALKDKKGSFENVNSLLGDMIVWDKATNTVIYPNNEDTSDTFYNTVRLVPPFGQKNKEDFFLLKLAAIKN